MSFPAGDVRARDDAFPGRDLNLGMNPRDCFLARAYALAKALWDDPERFEVKPGAEYVLRVVFVELR